MKKYFLAFCAVCWTSTASAGEFFYDYGGTANSFYGYSDYSSKYNRLYKHHHTPTAAELSVSAGYRFNPDNELVIGVDGQIAGGREVEDYNHGKWGENVYATYKSAYGEWSIGQIYNAAYQLAVGAPTVGYFKVNNSPMVDFLANPNWQRYGKTASYRTLNSTYLNTDADSLKISYTTPEFYRTRLAFSYAPDSYSRAGLVNKNSRYDNRSSYAAGIYNEAELVGLEVESSLGYAYNHKNNQEVSAGLSIYRKGWTLGGSYRKSFTSSGDYPLNIYHDSTTPYDFDGYRKGQAFNVGLSYEIGPFKTGVSYFAAYADKTDNEDKIITWANRFAFNKYIAAYLAAAYAEYKGKDSFSGSNRGFATIGGLELSL
ncbi:MAG: porin [Alphaproteobacteria bacterium]|nr:porin [Alphaproteobacteria bacterium]